MHYFFNCLYRLEKTLMATCGGLVFVIIFMCCCCCYKCCICAKMKRECRNIRHCMCCLRYSHVSMNNESMLHRAICLCRWRKNANSEETIFEQAERMREQKSRRCPESSCCIQWKVSTGIPMEDLSAKLN